jgi:hypothetical protein
MVLAQRVSNVEVQVEEAAQLPAAPMRDPPSLPMMPLLAPMPVAPALTSRLAPRARVGAGQVTQDNGTHRAGQTSVRVTAEAKDGSRRYQSSMAVSYWKTAFRPLPRSSTYP